MKTLRIGIVGGGGMGKVHYANWKAIDGIEIVALCDNAPAAPATAAEWGVPLFTSITDMVTATGVDVVDICTPTFLHHDMVMESLKLGVDTICEGEIYSRL
jgi:predicted dehydrogenase